MRYIHFNLNELTRQSNNTDGGEMLLRYVKYLEQNTPLLVSLFRVKCVANLKLFVPEINIQDKMRRKTVKICSNNDVQKLVKTMYLLMKIFSESILNI